MVVKYCKVADKIVTVADTAAEVARERASGGLAPSLATLDLLRQVKTLWPGARAVWVGRPCDRGQLDMWPPPRGAVWRGDRWLVKMDVRQRAARRAEQKAKQRDLFH